MPEKESDPATPEAPNQTSNISPQKPSQRWYAQPLILTLMSAVVILAAVAGGLYFQLRRSVVAPQQTINPSTSTPAVSTPTPETTGTQAPIPTLPLAFPQPALQSFTVGTYPLFPQSVAPTVTYLDDGVVTSGAYSGYHLVLADLNDGPAVDEVVFATKDYKTFVVDQSWAAEYDQKAAGNANGDPLFNTQVVTGTADLSYAIEPEEIPEGNFVLVSRSVNFTAPVFGASLPEGAGNLKFYNDEQYAASLAANNSVAQSYIQGTSDILAVDPAGVSYTYSIESKEQYSSAETSAPQYFYSSKDLKSASNFYATYGKLLPGGCGYLNDTYILQNITSADLVPVTSSADGTVLYTTKDQNSQINQDEYQLKIKSDSSVLGSSDSATSSSSPLPAPTYAQYVAKNPVLVFQDPFGRWMAVGEFDYEMIGGCGKPVIYLYPQSPTEVHVQFQNPIHLTTDIPTYSNGWNVLANPDGELKDLRPAATDCSKLNTKAIGSEYAASACAKGLYPYLYWAGQSSGSYPVEKDGWVVSRQDLQSFMNGTLNSVGFTAQEKSDMLSYWIPAMLQKGALYYRISFLQTAQMDSFIPMKVTPQPDSVYRLFLDWSPLSSEPAMTPQPEQLSHVVRRGFTLVEWGGLNQ